MVFMRISDDAVLDIYAC